MNSRVYFEPYDAISNPVWVTDPTGSLVYLNSAMAQLFSRDPVDLIGEPLSELLGPSNAIPDLIAVRQAVAEEGRFRSDFVHLQYPGGMGWYVLVAQAASYNEDDFLVFQAQDLTRQRLAEDNLSETTRLLNNIIGSTVLPVVIVNLGGVVMHFNPAAEKLCGIASQRAVGASLSVLVTEKTGRHFDAEGALQKSRDEGSCELEFGFPPVLGTKPRILAMTVMPLLDSNQMISGHLVLWRDVTESKTRDAENRRLAQQIQRAQKLESLGVLAGGIAHDFNNILIGILGNANLALMDLPPESPSRSPLREVERSAQRAAELVKQMLAYSGKGKFVVEELNLTRLVEEMSHLLEASIARSVVLRYHFAPTLPNVEGDAAQIRQVIMNLVTNASEAIGEKSGVVSISTGAMEVDADYLGETFLNDTPDAGIYAYIEVSDTGAGMDEATRQKIFDPFFSTKFTGRGLGLAAVLGIVRGHKGTIKVYSEPGRGSTFKVLLPARTDATVESAARMEEQVVTPGVTNQKTVLVVDDMDTVRAVARQTLERFGFRVLTAADGREAVQVYRQACEGIDLVLLDMTMPHMGGQETFRELRRINADVQVLLSSGYNEREATESFSGKGLAGFIQKPYKPLDLVRVVRQLLERANGGNGNGSNNGFAQ